MYVFLLVCVYVHVDHVCHHVCYLRIWICTHEDMNYAHFVVIYWF